MKKPLNKVALAMWVLAAIVVLAEVWTFVRAEHEYPAAGGAIAFIAVMWNLICASVISAAALVTFGTIIELLDQVRWNTLPVEQRKRD